MPTYHSAYHSHHLKLDCKRELALPKFGKEALCVGLGAIDGINRVVFCLSDQVVDSIKSPCVLFLFFVKHIDLLLGLFVVLGLKVKF